MVDMLKYHKEVKRLLDYLDDAPADLILMQRNKVQDMCDWVESHKHEYVEDNYKTTYKQQENYED